MHDHTDVLIIGAGPTGLLLACQLAWRGVRVRIVEKNAGPSRTSKALAIQARSLELFDQMGIVEPFLAQGQRGVGLHVYVKNQLRTRVQFGALGEGLSRYPFTLMLEQSKTERILLDHLQSLGVTVEWGRELQTFERQADSVLAQIRHATGGLETITTRYLVGADGAHSSVRRQLGLPFRGATSEQSFVLADAAVEGAVAHDAVNVSLLPTGIAAFFPLPGQQHFRVLGAIPADQVQAEGVDRAQFEAAYNTYLQQMGVQARIYNVDWFTQFRVHHRIVDTFQVGNVFLAGDAAHIHSPAGGQGMNTGLLDAANLAWKLAMVVQQQADPSLLASYHQERFPFAQQLVNTVDRVFMIISSTAPWAQFIRLHLAPLLLGQAAKLSFVQRLIFRSVSQTRFDYRAGPLALQDGDFGRSQVQPGDRLPYLFVAHPDSGEPICLHDLLRDPRWQLFCFERTGRVAPMLAPIAASCQWLRVHSIRHNAESEATFAELGVRTNALILVRPDGYIAYRNQPADSAQLTTALAKLGLFRLHGEEGNSSQ